jgi:hypothetical protein
MVEGTGEKMGISKACISCVSRGKSYFSEVTYKIWAMITGLSSS